MMNKPTHFLLAALLGVSFAATAAGNKIDHAFVQQTTLVQELYDGLYLAGTITGIDPAAGMVAMRTDTEGDVNLQFRPEALHGLKIGDVAVVNLGFSIDDRTIGKQSCDVLPVKVASC